MGRLATLRPRLAAVDMVRTKLPPKVADPELQTAEHRIWRAAVIANAGGRCQWPEGCEKAAPRHRMFADHIRERKDGGAHYDPANGQCLCGQHHSLKTARERARRHAEQS
ncbi:MAG: HNH endonuclease signature motif containing protein [Methylorubrum rhodinum]|uniref:HNH endonuclease signature motif containing protein n=1 Tax=Methylorubrum rhodinum TaxID=29428 RepID=UPI003BB052CE